MRNITMPRAAHTLILASGLLFAPLAQAAAAQFEGIGGTILPPVSVGTFPLGEVGGDALTFPTDERLSFPNDEGTIEFWLSPNWAARGGPDYYCVIANGRAVPRREAGGTGRVVSHFEARYAVYLTRTAIVFQSGDRLYEVQVGAELGGAADIDNSSKRHVAIATKGGWTDVFLDGVVTHRIPIGYGSTYGSVTALGGLPRGAYGDVFKPTSASDGVWKSVSDPTTFGDFIGSIGGVRIWNRRLHTDVLLSLNAQGASGVPPILKYGQFHIERDIAFDVTRGGASNTVNRGDLIAYSDFSMAPKVADSSPSSSGQDTGVRAWNRTSASPFLRLKDPIGGHWIDSDHPKPTLAKLDPLLKDLEPMTVVNPETLVTFVPELGSTYPATRFKAYRNGEWVGDLLRDDPNDPSSATFLDLEGEEIGATFSIESDTLVLSATPSGFGDGASAGPGGSAKKVRLKRNPLRDIGSPAPESDVFLAGLKIEDCDFSLKSYNLLTMDPVYYYTGAKETTGSSRWVFARAFADEWMLAFGTNKVMPNGFHYIDKHEAGGGVKTVTMSTEREVMLAVRAKFGIKGGVPGVAKVGVTGSGNFSETASAMSQTVSTFGQAYGKVGTAIVDPMFMRLHEDFIKAINDLAITRDFDGFIEDFGTHYARGVTQGAMQWVTRSWTETALSETSSMGLDVSNTLEVGPSKDPALEAERAGGFSVGQKERESWKLEEAKWGGVGTATFGTNADLLTVTPDSSGCIPIAMDLRPLHELLTPLYFDDPAIYAGLRFELRDEIMKYLRGRPAATTQVVEVPPLIRSFKLRARISQFKSNASDAGDVGEFYGRITASAYSDHRNAEPLLIAGATPNYPAEIWNATNHDKAWFDKDGYDADDIEEENSSQFWDVDRDDGWIEFAPPGGLTPKTKKATDRPGVIMVDGVPEISFTIDRLEVAEEDLGLEFEFLVYEDDDNSEDECFGPATLLLTDADFRAVEGGETTGAAYGDFYASEEKPRKHTVKLIDVDTDDESVEFEVETWVEIESEPWQNRDRALLEMLDRTIKENSPSMRVRSATGVVDSRDSGVLQPEDVLAFFPCTYDGLRRPGARYFDGDASIDSVDMGKFTLQFDVLVDDRDFDVRLDGGVQYPRGVPFDEKAGAEEGTRTLRSPLATGEELSAYWEFMADECEVWGFTDSDKLRKKELDAEPEGTLSTAQAEELAELGRRELEVLKAVDLRVMFDRRQDGELWASLRYWGREAESPEDLKLPESDVERLAALRDIKGKDLTRPQREELRELREREDLVERMVSLDDARERWARSNIRMDSLGGRSGGGKANAAIRIRLPKEAVRAAFDRGIESGAITLDDFKRTSMTPEEIAEREELKRGGPLLRPLLDTFDLKLKLAKREVPTPTKEEVLGGSIFRDGMEETVIFRLDRVDPAGSTPSDGFWATVSVALDLEAGELRWQVLDRESALILGRGTKNLQEPDPNRAEVRQKLWGHAEAQPVKRVLTVKGRSRKNAGGLQEVYLLRDSLSFERMRALAAEPRTPAEVVIVPSAYWPFDTKRAVAVARRPFQGALGRIRDDALMLLPDEDTIEVPNLDPRDFSLQFDARFTDSTRRIVLEVIAPDGAGDDPNWDGLVSIELFRSADQEFLGVGVGRVPSFADQLKEVNGELEGDVGLVRAPLGPLRGFIPEPYEWQRVGVSFDGLQVTVVGDDGSGFVRKSVHSVGTGVRDRFADVVSQLKPGQPVRWRIRADYQHPGTLLQSEKGYRPVDESELALIDEVRFWRGAMTDRQLQNSMREPRAFAPKDMAQIVHAYLPFEFGDNSVAPKEESILDQLISAKGRAHHGALLLAPGSPSGGRPIIALEGKEDVAVTVAEDALVLEPGVPVQFSVPEAQLSNLTLHMDFRPGDGRLLMTRGPLQLEIDAGHPKLTLKAAKANQSFTYDPAYGDALKPDAWHKLVLSIDAWRSRMTVFLDGESAGPVVLSRAVVESFLGAEMAKGAWELSYTPKSGSVSRCQIDELVLMRPALGMFDLEQLAARTRKPDGDDPPSRILRDTQGAMLGSLRPSDGQIEDAAVGYIPFEEAGHGALATFDFPALSLDSYTVSLWFRPDGAPATIFTAPGMRVESDDSLGTIDDKLEEFVRKGLIGRDELAEAAESLPAALDIMRNMMSGGRTEAILLLFRFITDMVHPLTLRLESVDGRVLPVELAWASEPSAFGIFSDALIKANASAEASGTDGSEFMGTKLSDPKALEELRQILSGIFKDGGISEDFVDLRGSWHQLVLSMDVAAGEVRGSLDGRPLRTISLPRGFVLKSPSQPLPRRVTVGPLPGDVDELLILNGAPKGESPAWKHLIQRPRIDGSPVDGQAEAQDR